MMSTFNQHQIQTLFDNYVSMEKEVAQYSALFDRLDVTIEKLTEVSSNISQLLAVQGNRLEFQEKVSEQLQKIIDKHKEETNSNVKEIHNKIENVKLNIEKEIKERDENILSEIKSMRENSEIQHSKIEMKFDKFQKIIYYIFGGATVILFLLDKINLSAIFG